MRFLNTCQSLFQSLEWECEPAIVDAHAVQDGGVQIVQMNRLFRDVVTEVVGVAEGRGTLDAATSQPHTEVARVMVSTIGFLVERSL